MEVLKREKYKIILKYFLFLVIFLLLSAGEINFSVKPFLFAFLFSLVWCNQNPLVCSLFYVGAMLLINPINLGLIISLIFTISILLFFYYLHKKLNKPINRYIFLLYALLSQIAFIYYSFTTPENLINAIVSVFIGLILIICYNTFFSSVFVKGLNAVFTINELISACIFLMSISVGISCIKFINFELIKIFAVFMILLSIFILDAKSGFVVAITMGVGNCLATFNITYLAVFSVFTLCAYCFKSNNKYLSSLAICLIDVFCGLYLKVYPSYTIYSVFSTVLGALLFVLIPNHIIENLKSYFGGFNSSMLYRNLINSTKSSIMRRLNEISEVFLDMELNFKNMVKGTLPKNEAKELLLNEVCSKVCNDCREKHTCLRVKNEETINGFSDMLEKGFEKGKVTLLDIPLSLSTHCNRAANIISTMNGLLNSYKQYSYMVTSSDTSKVLIGEQMGGVSKLLKTLIEDTATNFKFDLSKENEIKEELKFLHIYCSDVISYVKDNIYNISLILKKSDYNEKNIEELISKIVKVKMKILSKNELNTNFDILELKNAPKYDCIFGMSGATKNNNQISGDTYSFIKINEDKVLMALNDGMGSGENAQKTSEVSLNLIENFYRAGFDNEIILNSVNKLLTINSEETFSALDICVIDFTKEIYDFIKMGAPVGFIKKESGVEIIESGSLPIGILEGISPVITKKVISGDEIIILVSDGVLESFNGEEKLSSFISSCVTNNPQTLCDKIINECKRNEITDDCTVLALRIFEIID